MLLLKLHLSFAIYIDFKESSETPGHSKVSDCLTLKYVFNFPALLGHPLKGLVNAKYKVVSKWYSIPIPGGVTGVINSLQMQTVSSLSLSLFILKRVQPCYSDVFRDVSTFFQIDKVK